LPDVRQSRTTDDALKLSFHLPHEAGDALLLLAEGRQPQRPAPVAPGADPFVHPDAQRRFRVVANVEELEQALAYPWEKWIVFLHPAQRVAVERDYGGPARISGSAGTGKTIVALHRAAFLARQNPDARVLLTTFSDTLANALKAKLHLLVGREPRVAERLEVQAIDAVARRLYKLHVGRAEIASPGIIRMLLQEAADQTQATSVGALLAAPTGPGTVVSAVARAQQAASLQRPFQHTSVAPRQGSARWAYPRSAVVRSFSSVPKRA
ncbi:MAG: UvrD-helicase domain-containing protein, partial [Chloroflexi bacterium]|nr:UvrD-helicase domain-containing protein [Chloroflexota bacterium]